jgi:ABC-type lipoprotein export system ATPase subunit
MAVDGINANEALGFYGDNFRDLVRDNHVLVLLAKMRESLISVRRNGAITRVLSILPKLTVELIGFLIFGLVFLSGNGNDLVAQAGVMIALLLGVQKVSPQLSRIFSCLTLLNVGLRVINRLSGNPKFPHTSIRVWINSVLSTRHQPAMLDDDVLFCIRLESISCSENLDTKCKLNFELKTGDVLAIAGISGSGKSTIMDLIAGLASEFDGEILMNSKYFSNFQDFRNFSFYLFQGRDSLSLEILQDTVTKLLEVEYRPMAEAFGIIEVCQSIESNAKQSCFDQQDKYSGSLTTSGGEAQRLLLAHALLSGKKILIVDEGFSGFGSDQAAKILGYLRMYFEDVAVIIVSHDTDIQKLCDRVVRLG